MTYKSALVAENIGRTVGEIISSLIPLMVISILVFGITPPATPEHAYAFILLTLGSVILNYFIKLILGTTVFWVISAAHPNSVDLILSTIFAGRIVPLWFFPGYIISVANWLPYQFLYFLPVAVYLGKVQVEEFTSIFLIQWSWIAGMILLDRLVWSKAIKKTVIQGG